MQRESDLLSWRKLKQYRITLKVRAIWIKEALGFGLNAFWSGHVHKNTQKHGEKVKNYNRSGKRELTELAAGANQTIMNKTALFFRKPSGEFILHMLSLPMLPEGLQPTTEDWALATSYTLQHQYKIATLVIKKTLRNLQLFSRHILSEYLHLAPFHLFLRHHSRTFCLACSWQTSTIFP